MGFYNEVNTNEFTNDSKSLGGAEFSDFKKKNGALENKIEKMLTNEDDFEDFMGIVNKIERLKRKLPAEYKITFENELDNLINKTAELEMSDLDIESATNSFFWLIFVLETNGVSIKI